MKLRALIRALTLSVVGLGGVAVAAAACGQDPASCGGVCPLNSSSADCPNTCASLQSTCDAANAGADFQALLTCVANANGALSPLPELCQADYAIVATNCGATIPDGGFVGGTDASGG